MKVWVVLSGLLFFAQCADRARPFLSVILGKKEHASQHGAPSDVPHRPQ